PCRARFRRRGDAVTTRNRNVAAATLAAVLVAAAGIGIGWYRGTHGRAAHASAEYFCPMHPTIVRDQPGECPICGMKLEARGGAGASAAAPSASPAGARRILFYRHPMDPSIHSDHPAKDGMGMDYVPVYAGDAETASSVPGRAPIKVPPPNAQLLGIR